jgi:hypothetical protein
MGVRPMDRAEWERQAATVLPKIGGRAPTWMRGPIEKEPRFTRQTGRVKVPGADRKVYDRCASAMLAGYLFSFVIDQRSGNFLVRVREADDWSELMRHEVAELLATIEGVAPAPIVERSTVVGPIVPAGDRDLFRSPAEKAARDRRRGPAPVVEAATVAEIEEALAPVAMPSPVVAAPVASGTTWPAAVVDYLARLVFEPKQLYAAAVALAMIEGGPMPEDPGTEWAEKARRKLDRLVPAGVGA